MRGRRLPPHHLFPRPSRRDGGLHHPHRGRQSRRAGAARQRQSDRSRRPAGHRPPFRGLARSVSEAVLSVRAGRRHARLRRGPLPHHVGPRRHAAHLCRARQGGPLRLRHGLAQALHALGRRRVRPRIRSRHLHDRRGVRLQHGRDGEQGPQHLQRQIRAGLAGDRDRRRLRFASRRSSRTNISTTGPATASPAATGSSSASRKASRSFATRSSRADERSRAVERIGDVRGLRAHQFVEDAGPLAHPVRPDALSRDQQFLHRDRLREGRRGRAHAQDAARPGQFPQRHGPLLRPPRRRGRDGRAVRAMLRRRVRHRSRAVHALVLAGRHAGSGRRRPLRSRAPRPIGSRCVRTCRRRPASPTRSRW